MCPLTLELFHDPVMASDGAGPRGLIFLGRRDSKFPPMLDARRRKRDAHLDARRGTRRAGHTYERCAVEEWLATGAISSPTTNAPLPSKTLVPNFTVKKLVAAFLDERR